MSAGTMQLPLTGGCLCGALRYEISETPQMAYTRHSTDCQHLTSSAFSLAITVPDSAFRLTKGEPRLLQKIAESGRTVTRWLCPDCGCWVTSSPQPGASPGEMIRRVRGGTLDDTSWLRPSAHFWTRSKQPWVVLPEGSNVFATQPDLEQFFNRMKRDSGGKRRWRKFSDWGARIGRRCAYQMTG